MWRNKLFLGVMCLAIFLVAIPTANADEVGGGPQRLDSLMGAVS